MSIEVHNVSKSFGNFQALKSVSLEFPAGQLVALLGPSGSGKTTLLRIIAGLESLDAGEVRFFGQDATRVHARKRQVGFVFQHYALFRHMTVFENVAFGLRVKPRAHRPSETDIQARVNQLLKLVQLDWLGDRFPSQLSGGQRQRVALARALAVEPQVLLLDEPFGALDANVRKELRRWLRRLHDEIHVTSVFVTHDVEEALEVSDQIVVMNEGRIEQIGTPEYVYEHPATPFVFNFLGHANVFHLPPHPQARNGSLVYARPHDIEVHKNRDREDLIPARIIDVRTIGPVARLELSRQDTGEHVEAELTKSRLRELGVSTGATVYLYPRNPTVYETGSVPNTNPSPS